MSNVKKDEPPIEDPILAHLVKQSECNLHGMRTRMLMYDKSDYAKAKFDQSAECIVKDKKGKCSNEMDRGNRPIIQPEDKYIHKRKLKPPPPPCPVPGHPKPSHAPIIEMGHRVRICTMSELQQICPEPCLKPAVIPKPRLFYRIGSLAVKIAIAGSLVWCTYGMGLWGDGYKTEKMVNDALKAFRPKEKRDDFRGGSCPAAIERAVFEFRDAYNRTAIAITSFPMRLPHLILPKSGNGERDTQVKATSGSGRCYSHELL